MDTFLTVVHVIVCIFLVLVVLLQAGKGGGMGIAFGGSGGGGSVFGGSGAGSFLSKLTVTSAFMFMATSMTLAYLAGARGDDPLKALSAKSRAAAQSREDLRKQILEAPDAPEPGADEGTDEGADEGTDEGGDEGGVNTPDQSAIDTPEAAAPEAAAPEAADPAPAEAPPE